MASAARAGAACTAMLLNKKRTRRRDYWAHGGTKEELKTNTNSKLLFSKSPDPNPVQDRETKENKEIVFSQEEEDREEVRYLWKLGGGCVAGGVVIKYGSVLFPAIPTTPNLTVALLMISTPMLLSVLLLITQTYVDQQQQQTKDSS